MIRQLVRALVALVIWQTAILAAPLERGAAVTDPDVLHALDRLDLGLGRMLGADVQATGAAVFALPSMETVRAAIDRDVARYGSRHRDLPPNDLAVLYSPQTRFELAGIVNRMDRAYVAPSACGEIRLIYRPLAHASGEGGRVPQRFPMTLSLIVHAKPADAGGLSCAELAGRWLAWGDAGSEAAGLADTLKAGGGMLEYVTPAAIDRIEINLQLARAAAVPGDFEGRADYLMKVFRYDAAAHRFNESAMENQIDRERIRSDAALAADFQHWLLDPENFAALDRGTIVVPDRFLATSAIGETPSRDDRETAAHELFAENGIVAALVRASERAPLQNIQSPAGFARRLDDITCSGCHQTRSVGNFHFPGREPPGQPAASTVVAAASPHFFGDQERRRDILGAFRDGMPPDFSRGFSARPQTRRAHELDGTTYFNGWGALCYAARGDAAPDRSFASWTCADGLTCQPLPGAKEARSGFCFPKGN